MAVACRWQPGMKITALLDVLNSALAETFALAWSQDSPRFLRVLTVVYAVAVIVAVTDQKNTRPGAEQMCIRDSSRAVSDFSQKGSLLFECDGVVF